MTDPNLDVSTLIPDFLTDDTGIRDHIRARLMEVIDASFDNILDVLETGDQASRAALTKSILPEILKVRKATDELDTADVELMHEEVRSMIFGMGEELPGADSLNTIPDVAPVLPASPPPT